MQVTTNIIKNNTLSLTNRTLNTSIGGGYLGNKSKRKEINSCTCKCKCIKCDKPIDFISEELEYNSKNTAINNNSLNNLSNNNPFENLKTLDNLQGKNFLEFLFILSDFSLTKYLYIKCIYILFCFLTKF